MVYFISDVLSFLESWAPPAYQEGYDNAQLIVGNPSTKVTGILCTLDATEEVVAEAAEKGCNLIIAHHPIVFKGLKSLTGKTYVERTVIKAIKEDIAIYAIHTNLDHVMGGVNSKIAEKLGLTNTRILSPKAGILAKLVTFIPVSDTAHVLQGLFAAGAGEIGAYRNCSFRVNGIGTFLPTEKANPTLGIRGVLEEVAEDRVEILFPKHLSTQIVSKLRQIHPYEEVAYYLQSLENENQEVGAGMIGELEAEMDELAFLTFLKSAMNLSIIRHTKLLGRKIRRVAVCGGAGIFLLGAAKRAGADLFITADVKYHEFFDADNQLIIVDIGHYESEFFTKELLKDKLSEKFANIALYLSNAVTNPISYL
ncbi:MAG: Nif3-like dinuclear metal center hexameric protein [Lunatimonas sp.]|uniref:Nif3-like dinuclear metal center hexameric protein n=1 Tax=Lunatimonas sp. TaxID=2060141 RepID=UPI00263AC29C|nr:Nif3-like dinuclear metal center hexameric protein [Lunatimonas sp.]MCC5939497.1 Nif3-like dinuclear metal center hexameric protein [Lunatimonas sp.]